MPETRVLFVEDEMLLRELTRQDLADSGFEVTCAANGTEALSMLENGKVFDTLITDIRMPGEPDGWELARLARDRQPGLRVIYVSGYSAEQVRCVPGGVFLKKPYRFEELRGAMAAAGC